MKKNLLFAFFLTTSLINTSFGQSYFYSNSYFYRPFTYELGVNVGAINCLTDIGGNEGIGKRFVKDLNYNKTRFAYGLYFTAMYRNAVGLRLEGMMGNVEADDAVLEDVPVSDIAKARYNRNLNFRSKINELSLTAEIHPLYVLIDWAERERAAPRISPYFLGGIGYYSFNPQARLNFKYIDLQPLSTEGQGFKEYPDRKVYKLRQFNYPLGFGVKYELTPNINVRAEYVYRILNTDYLDDVSTNYVDPRYFQTNGFTGERLTNAILLSDRQINPITGPGGKRGSPAENDAFFTFNLKIGIILASERMKE